MKKQELWKWFFVIFHDLSVDSSQELVLRPLPWTCGTTLESVWTHSQRYLDHLSSLINIFLNIFKSLQSLVMKLSSCWHPPWAGSEKQGFSLPINPSCGVSCLSLLFLPHGSFGTSRIPLVLSSSHHSARYGNSSFALVSLDAPARSHKLFLIVFLPFSFSAVPSDLNLALA